MNKKKISICLATAMLVIAGWLPIAALANHTLQSENMFSLRTGNVTGGAGTLTRTMDGVWGTLYASGLRSNTAYTVWWVGWNDPSECLGDCGLADADFDLPDNNFVCYAGGFVTGADRTANVTVHLESGHLADGQECVIPGELMPGNGFGVELHLVLRTHGKIKKGSVAAQIGSFNGACDTRRCIDTHAVVFVAVVPAMP